MKTMDNRPIVYVVHCIDTEGPLYESLEATFKRLKQTFGIDLEPTKENLKKLQKEKINLDGQEERIAEFVSPELMDYNETWDEINHMLSRIGSKEFREKVTDSFGRGWIYNWHCVDHIGYDINPRRKDIGYHNVFDHYRRFVKRTNAPDGIHWHFHPEHPVLNASHKAGTFYLKNSKFYDIISRRIIERHWFPSVNRAGFHVERPDSHWLLEQWIPFDISNQSCARETTRADQRGARYGDWRRAPTKWSVYNPSYDDYQVPGNCRRYIGRCLSLGTSDDYSLTRADVEQAFVEAEERGRSLLGITGHDYRDLEPDVDHARHLLAEVSQDYPEVDFRYSEARTAMNFMIFGDCNEPDDNIFSYDLEIESDNNKAELSVNAEEKIFGPQPFLAIKTGPGEYYYDNFDFEKPFEEWSYVFDRMTFPWSDISKIGIGTNDKRGFPHILVINPDKSDVRKTIK